ncbi:MAG: hypothetical protein KIT41_10045 [Pyrinomonadaceae bacterium]|nr:hypothetical protein [Pyrinomonadaceae bacterium]
MLRRIAEGPASAPAEVVATILPGTPAGGTLADVRQMIDSSDYDVPASKVRRSKARR